MRRQSELAPAAQGIEFVPLSQLHWLGRCASKGSGNGNWGTRTSPFQVRHSEIAAGQAIVDFVCEGDIQVA